MISPPSQKALLIYSNANTALRHQADLTPKTAVEGVSLPVLRKECKEGAAAAMTVLLEITARQLNLNRTLNEGQMSVLIGYIFRQFYHLKIDEVFYALRQGAAGAYGPTYQRLDIEVVSEWLRQYDVIERAPMIEQLRVSESQQHKANTVGARSPEEQARWARYYEVLPHCAGKSDAELREWVGQLATHADATLRPYAPAVETVLGMREQERRAQEAADRERRGDEAFSRFKTDFYATRGAFDEVAQPDEPEA